MNTTKSSYLTLCFDDESTKRISITQKQLSRTGNVDPVFDDKVVSLLNNFQNESQLIKTNRVRDYLNRLKDEEGIPYSRSYYDYHKLLVTLESFAGKHASNFSWNQHFKRALAAVRKRYPSGKLTPLRFHSDEDVIKSLPKMDSHAGHSYLRTGLRKKGEYIDGIYEELISKEKQAIVDGSFNCLTLLGTRTSVKGEFGSDGSWTGSCVHTSRPIHMKDIYENLSAARFAEPVTAFLQGYAYSAIGKSDNDIWKRVRNMSNSMIGWVSLDYSKFDSTQPAWLIDRAFDVLEGCYVMSEAERKLFYVVKHDYIHKTFLLADGYLSVHDGTPSGSSLTSIINGIINELITETWISRFNVQAKYMIMGDDNLICLKDDIDMNVIATYIVHNFGIVVNAEKSLVGTRWDDPEFLSRTWTARGPWRPFQEVLARMMFPERYRDYTKPGVRPEFILFSYILGYSATMREIMDVDAFIIEYGFDQRKVLSREEMDVLPYNLQVYINATAKVA